MLILIPVVTSSGVLAGCAPTAQPAPTAVAQQPAGLPTAARAPTKPPTAAPTPTEMPTQEPVTTPAPTAALTPTEAPTQTPTAVPTEAPAPTDTPVPTLTAAPTQATALTFNKDIRPLIERRCINCHGGKDGIKGGLSLKTYADLMKGGESGAAIMPGDPANSLLVQLVKKGEMPKRAPKLPQSEIDLITAWVAAGAAEN
ncbi:MAG: c-type cytochrome domain-containing protein [Anaerolineae bacterium]